MFEQVGSDLTFYARYYNRSNGSPSGTTPTVSFYKIAPDGTKTNLNVLSPVVSEIASNTGIYYTVLDGGYVDEVADYVVVFSTTDTNVSSKIVESIYHVGRAGIGVLAKPFTEVTAPTELPTLEQALMLLYMALRNKSVTAGDLYQLFDNAGANVIAEAELRDTGEDFTRDTLVEP